MRTWVTLTTLVLVSSVTSLAFGQDAGRSPSHEGLLFRVTAGFGGGSTESDLSPTLEMSGGAGFLSFDLGGTVAQRLVLHGRISGHTLVEPDVSVGGEEVGELADGTLTLSMLGVGVTYYFPANLYLTGVVGLSRARLTVDDSEFESETGGGLNLDVGYEWAVGGDWGIGIAGRFEYHSIPAADGDDSLGSTAFGVLFSATYH